HSLRSAWEMNCGPLSVTMSFGTPNLAIILRITNLTTVLALISANASASAHLVKYSVAVRINDFLLVSAFAYTNRTITSKAHMENGNGEVIGWTEDAGACILSA